MVLESTVICIDNGEYMRNGDFIPTRMQAEQDAANLLVQCKLRSNPENCVALLTMAPTQKYRVGLTNDSAKLMSKLHQVELDGFCEFIDSMKTAQLALKHRQNRNHKTRIIVFVGSPVKDTAEKLVELAKKFKKEKVYVDVVSFGEEDSNGEKLRTFIETLNGKDQTTSSHLVVVPAGSNLQEALLQSPVVRGDDGDAPTVALGAQGGFDFGVDPNEDPELAMALRVSLEEQRQRDEQQARQQSAAAAAAGGSSDAAVPMEVTPSAATTTDVGAVGGGAATTAALATTATPAQPTVDWDAMTEEEQMEYALRICLASDEAASAKTPPATTSATAASGASTSGEDKNKKEDDDRKKQSPDKKESDKKKEQP